MIRLTLFLGGSIWAAMAFAPELSEPVFTEQVAEATLVEETAPEVTRTALTSPVAMVVPVVAPTPDPVQVAALTEPTPERIIWFVTGSRVNVRQGPSTKYGILDKVLYGDAAEIISDPEADWVKIRIEGDGVEGFVMKRFMTDIDPLE